MRKFPILLLALCLLALLLPAAALAAKPAPPTINPVSVGDPSINGTCVSSPDTELTIISSIQGTFPLSASDTSSWSFSFPYSLQPGETITVTQTVNGETSDPAIVIIPVPAPTIDTPVIAGDNVTITGTCYDDPTTVVLVTNSAPPLSALVTDGTWTLADLPLVAGNIIYVFQTVNGEVSPATTVIVSVPAPTIDTPIIAGDNVTITGTCFYDAGPKTELTVTVPSLSPEVITATSSTWSMIAPSLAPGDIITVIQRVNDEANPPVSATVAPPKPTIDTPHAGDTFVSGTGYPGATVYLTAGGLSNYATTVDASSGTWHYDFSPFSLNEGSVITAQQVANGASSDTVYSQVVYEEPTIDTPILAGTDVTITGTCYFDPGAITSIIISGQSFIADSSTWSVTVPSLAPGDVVLVTQSVDGVRNRPVTATVIPPEPTINQPHHGDTVLSGTGYPGAGIFASDGNRFNNATWVRQSGVWDMVNITPLIAGQTFSVTQTMNDITSPVANITVLPAAPGAPIPVSATPGDRQVTLTWAAPTDNGGKEVLSYTISELNDKISPITGVSATPPLAYEVTNLINGQTYTFQILAVTDGGPGPNAPFQPVTPIPAPGQPQNVTATAGNTTATLRWEPPTDTGGLPILGYQVSKGDGFWHALPANARAHTFSDLTNGQPYTLYVKASTAAGDGPAATATTTPQRVPAPPELVRPTVRDGVLLGTAEPNATVTITISGTSHTVTADASGNWQFLLPVPLTLTDTITAYQTVGGVDSPATAPVTPLPGSETTLTIDPLYENDPFITGTCEAGGQIYLVFGGSARRITPYHTLGAGALAQMPGTPANVVGTRWYYNVSGLSLRAGDTVTAIQILNGETKNITRTVLADRSGFLPPVTINPPAPGDTRITGTSVPGATVTITGPDGTPIGTVDVDWTGEWTYPLPAPIQPDDIYLVTQTVGPLTSAPVPAAPASSGKAATKAFEAPPSGYGVITGSRVNARERPSLDATVLTQLSQGTRVRIVDWGMTGDDGSGPWCKITVGDQMYFVHNDYVDGTAPF